MSLEIDCSFGEGGGSIVRISIALAAAIGIPLTLRNIRANRPKPGLRAQHLEAINSIKQFSGVRTEGTEIGSETVSIFPTSSGKNEANVRISTAGSVSLVAQAVQYYSFINNTKLELKIDGGATHGKWAPSIEYVENVTFKIFEKMGKKIDIKLDRFGFYPKGGAKVNFVFHTHKEISSLNMTEKGELEEIQAISISSSQLKKRRVAERQMESFVKNMNPEIEIKQEIKYVDSFSIGTGLNIFNKYSSGSVKGCFLAGERNITAEKVGEMCYKKWMGLEKNSASIDPYATDQLIVPMALAEESSIISTDSITNHTKTNIELIRKFTDAQIKVTKENDIFYITVKQP